jgi:hypothetical protein
LSGLREENSTSCPAFASSSPMAPPMFPDPMNPIFIGRDVWGVVWAPAANCVSAHATTAMARPRRACGFSPYAAILVLFAGAPPGRAQ